MELFLIDFSIKTLWQRLAAEDEKIFDRCDTTEAVLEEAAQKLNRSLKEPGIDSVLKKKLMSPSAFL